MQQVIIWGMVLMLCIFGIGLLSAIKSQKRRESAPRIQQVLVREVVEDSPKKGTAQENMAAGGVPNGEGNLASVGSSTR
jgi:hypothetical protein